MVSRKVNKKTQKWDEEKQHASKARVELEATVTEPGTNIDKLINDTLSQTVSR